MTRDGRKTADTPGAHRWTPPPVVLLGVTAVVALVLIAPLLVSDHRPSVRSAERDLIDTYIGPLRAAGIDVDVQSLCHYRTRSEAEPWHLEATVVARGSRTRVADVLTEQVDVIRRGPADWSTQQHRNHPEAGWKTMLVDLGPDTRIIFLRNNVEADREADLGWQAVCAFPES